MLFIIAIYVNISHKYLQENLSVYTPGTTGCTYTTCATSVIRQLLCTRLILLTGNICANIYR